MSERASRISSYKNAGQGVNDLRRKRVELSVTLRKQAREDQLLKRRALSPEHGDEEPQTTDKLPTPSEIVEGLKSDDLATLTASARAARRMLSREQNPPIAILVDAGIIKPLVDALDHHECVDLLFEASWALTNIASGSHEQTRAVVEGGAVPKLSQLLALGGTVGEQCAWALGNIAGDGAQTRDIVLSHGALRYLLPILSVDSTPNQLRTAVWTYSNFCRNKSPMVKFELVEPALPYISELLEINDQDVLSDACWALSYLTDGPNDRIEAVQMVPKLLTRLLKLLDHKSASVKTPALRALGNMVTGSDEQTDRCLDVGCLDYLKRLLTCSKSSIIKEACWAVSNVLAGTHEQIQRAIDKNILDDLVRVILTEDIKCQKEAAWAITNLCLGGTVEQLDALFATGFLEPYCNLLTANDFRVVTVVLEGITHILQAAEKHGKLEALCLKLEEIGALDKIEVLQQHENEQIYKKTLAIIDTYFTESEDVIAQPEKNDKEYTFGTTNPTNQLQF